MPGFLETTLHQGYDYLSPYVEKAQPYVEKVRDNVPLIDPALKKAEELVPLLITRADELAEPHVEKMRPYVEPRIEQVKGKVGPYVDTGVKKYGVLRDGGVSYYNVGLEKFEQVKGFKDAKETQIREFKEARVTQIKGLTDPKVEMIKEFKEARVTQIHAFTDPKVEKIKEFKEARVTQIHKFTDPKVEKIKGAMEPKVAVITARKEKMQKLLRVPAFLDLHGLNCETLLGKVASGLEKVEALIERYVPLTEEQMKDNDSDSSASDTSCARINRSVVSILARLLFMSILIIKLVLNFPSQLKTSYKDGTLKAKLGKFTKDTKRTLISKVDHAKVEGKKLRVSLKSESRHSIVLRIKNKVAPTKAKVVDKLTPLLEKVIEKLAPIMRQLVKLLISLTQVSLFKKVLHMAHTVSEKLLGKERTATVLSKAETLIPAAWKPSAASSSPASKPASAGRLPEQRQQPQSQDVRRRQGQGQQGQGKGQEGKGK